MNETQDALKMMANYIDTHNKYLFNLLEILVDRGILNSSDLIFIRHHGISEDK